jgi:AmmeMemoRadiSam system protein B
MLRQPAVAGRFYPANPNALTTMLDGFLPPDAERLRAIGIVVPHAGYMYSGAVAGAVYSRIEIPSRAIILCPNHTGLGSPLSIMREGAWKTPLGQMRIDVELCDALMEADLELENDVLAQKFEHAIEVHLPFLQRLRGDQIRFAPITVGVSNWSSLELLGRAIGDVVSRVDRSTLIVASSDMNHYESDAVTRVKDAKAIEPMLRMEARDLYQTVRREDISMCGFGPATATILAARQLGAARGELIRYATSADVSQDFERVVGYSGIVLL